jgi:hypothetical protein
VELLAILVRRGELVSACALIRAHHLAARPQPLLEKAAALGDANLLASVCDFFEALKGESTFSQEGEC